MSLDKFIEKMEGLDDENVQNNEKIKNPKKKK